MRVFDNFSPKFDEWKIYKILELLDDEPNVEQKGFPVNLFASLLAGEALFVAVENVNEFVIHVVEMRPQILSL